MDDAAEESFWRFDARRKGYSQWKGMPQSERDAFKAEIAALGAQLEQGQSRVRELEAERDKLLKRLKRATELCASQAEDEGIWFIAETITEDYLQRALRNLHRAIEE